MNNTAGLILKGEKPKGLVHFFINSKEEAIDSLIANIELGCEVSLSDNRNKREGTITFRKKESKYIITEGGHGFCHTHEALETKEIESLIKSVFRFNLGEHPNNYGTLKKVGANQP